MVFHVDEALIDSLAAALHENYRSAAAKNGWPLRPEANLPYVALAQQWKDANRAAARRIPAVLAVIGVTLRRASDAAAESRCIEAQLAARIDAAIERLAEAEHEGWMRERREAGWQYGPARDDARKIHPSFVPYAELPEPEREKDRNNVRSYPALIASLGDVVAVAEHAQHPPANRTAPE